MKRTVMVLLLLLVSGPVTAGNWSPADNVIYNLGSGYAFSSLCALNGFADPKRVAQLGNLYGEVLTEEAMKKFKRQYQKALHEKRLYSIYKDKWYEFKIGETECSTIDNAIEMAVEILRNKT